MRKSIALVICVVSLAGCRSAKEKAEYEEKKKALATKMDQEAAATKAVHDLQEKRLRAACKNQTAKMPSPKEVVSACERNIMDRAKGSVDFPGYMTRTSDKESVELVPNKCALSYASWFEGKNGFGKTVRTNFVCTWDAKDESTTVRTL